MNHPMLSGGIGLFVYDLAGLASAAVTPTHSLIQRMRKRSLDSTMPNNTTVLFSINPQVAVLVKSASVRVVLPQGAAELSWLWENIKFHANVSLPFGCGQRGVSFPLSEPLATSAVWVLRERVSGQEVKLLQEGGSTVLLAGTGSVALTTESVVIRVAHGKFEFEIASV
jgi:hypothetical protein